MINGRPADIELQDIVVEFDTPELEPEVEQELIEFDEALMRAGGFGLYQVLMFWACSIFFVYGDQIIFNFVYLTAPYKQMCQYPGEENFKVCSKEEICQNPQLLIRPNTEDKNYIYALSVDFQELNCWPDTSTAFMCQMWFFGFLV